VSKFTADVLRNYGVCGNKIRVSGNSIDHELIERINPATSAKAYDGVFVGRISKEKGIFDLLEIWRIVKRAKPDARLLIVGSGLEMPSLKEGIKATGLEENITVDDHCPDERLYRLMKSCRVFIFPSLFEGWGIATAEALACGLPVVSYDIPAIREIFGKCETVFLVKVKDIMGMASTILSVIDSGASEFLSFQSTSKEHVKKFSWTDVARTDLEALVSALKR